MRSKSEEVPKTDTKKFLREQVLNSCGACRDCASILLSGGNTVIDGDSTCSSSPKTCSICLGTLSSSVLDHETETAIVDAFLPYGTFDPDLMVTVTAGNPDDGIPKGRASRDISKEAPTISIPSVIMLRAYAAICYLELTMKNGPRNGDPQSKIHWCSPNSYYTRAKELIKQKLESKLSALAKESDATPPSTKALNSNKRGRDDDNENEEEGYMNCHILYTTTRPFPKALSCDESQYAKKRNRQRFRGSDPTLKQGGDPRANLETRAGAADATSLSLVQRAMDSHTGKLMETKERLATWIIEEAKLLSSPEEEGCKVYAAAWRLPFYVGGRYTKSRRDVSQSPFYVQEKGKTIKKGVSSVEEEICPVFSRACGGISNRNNSFVEQQPSEQQAQEDSTKPGKVVYGLCKFHASGREDIDVRMMASAGPMSGRPFVLMVIDAFRIPTKEQMDWAVRTINCIDRDEPIYQNNLYGKNAKGGVGIDSLSITTSYHYRNLQSDTESKVKHYGCKCWSQTPLPSQEKLDNLLTKNTSTVITQKTPLRVLHRRANLDRIRQVLTMKATRVDDHWFTLKLSTSAGTYVKEFVHGDLGRSVPSVGGILGCRADILELDCEGIGFEDDYEDDEGGERGERGKK